MKNRIPSPALSQDIKIVPQNCINNMYYSTEEIRFVNSLKNHLKRFNFFKVFSNHFRGPLLAEFHLRNKEVSDRLNSIYFHKKSIDFLNHFKAIFPPLQTVYTRHFYSFFFAFLSMDFIPINFQQKKFIGQIDHDVVMNKTSINAIASLPD